jgi:nucleotide-binding universal stress UspA family protein
MEHLNFKTILVPADFSKYSHRAYSLALDVGRCSGGKVVLIHVLDTDYITDVAHISTRDEYMERWRKRAEERMTKIFPGNQTEDVQVQVMFEEGKPYEKILEVADELKADLIILGSRGKAGLERALFGSVAGKVARLCEVPVLIVK